MSNILYHGRFQPPHSGHAQLIRMSLVHRQFDNCIVSLDRFETDKDNPFTVHERKMGLLGNLPDLSDRVLVCSHKRLEDVRSTLNKIRIKLANSGIEFDAVLQGPDCLDEVEHFWSDHNRNVIKPDKRFFGVSATKIRESGFHGSGTNA